ncbi:MAG: ubiquitin-like domain-containing protein [Candidatus Saccharimonadota bacterium]
MKLKLRNTTTYTSLCLAALGLFVVFAVLLFNLNRPAQAQVEGGRLITVYDRGSESTFVSAKPTLREAFEEMGIAIDARDAVEPSLDETLVAPEYQVNVYRARPVTVVDGATRQRIVTPYQTAERIVKDAGVSLFAEDTTSIERSVDLIGDGAGLQLIIDRATPLTIDLYGKKSEVRTQAETIGEMLEEKGVVLGSSDRASLASTTPIAANMELRIWREGKQTITVEEPLAFETEQIKDADRAIGYKEIQTPGKNGRSSVSYEIEIQNGLEVARTKIASVVIEPATKQVEIVGAKPNTLPYTGGGTKTEWLAASNIPQESWGYADFMVQKESGWNPNAVNSSSGACGLAQALPCSKLGPNWNNPVVALNWMNGYVNGRYYDGSPYAKGLCAGIANNWQCAYTYWQKYKWY